MSDNGCNSSNKSLCSWRRRWHGVILLGLRSLTAVNESEEDAMAQSILQVYSRSMSLISTIVIPVLFAQTPFLPASKVLGFVCMTLC